MSLNYFKVHKKGGAFSNEILTWVGERSEITNLLSRDSNAIRILFVSFDLGE
jgi:hypothetical protein